MGPWPWGVCLCVNKRSLTCFRDLPNEKDDSAFFFFSPHFGFFFLHLTLWTWKRKSFDPTSGPCSTSVSVCTLRVHSSSLEVEHRSYEPGVAGSIPAWSSVIFFCKEKKKNAKKKKMFLPDLEPSAELSLTSRVIFFGGRSQKCVQKICCFWKKCFTFWSSAVTCTFKNFCECRYGARRCGTCKWSWAVPS